MALTLNQDSYIPQEAYLYFPASHDAKDGDHQRNIFDGNTKFDQHEYKMITDFKNHAQKEKYQLKQPMWTDAMILRFLHANNFRMGKTLTTIKNYTSWTERDLPINLDKPLEDFLNSGLLYVHGRDHKYRPIVVFNVYKINPKILDGELIIKALVFWLEYLVDQFMLPGQVENWVFISNVKGLGLATVALQSVRKLFSYLQDNYRCRLAIMYIVNTPAAVYLPWQIVKKFMDEVTIKKIIFYKEQIPTALFEHTNREQIEQQFGGTAPNATKYWPPVIPSSNYKVSEKDTQHLTTTENYKSLYQAGSLENMRINKSYLEEPLEIKSAEPKLNFVNNQSLYANNISNAHQSVSDSVVLKTTPLEERLDKSLIIKERSIVEESEEEADYAEYMSENVEKTGRASVVMNDFEGNFTLKTYFRTFTQRS